MNTKLPLIAIAVLGSFAIVIAQSKPAAVLQQSQAEKPSAPARAEVLILGTYHMANRGHDIYNLHADDVLSPKRQAEIAQVIEVLKRFNPTKIAVEADLLSLTNPTTNERPKQYADYLEGKHELANLRLRKLAEFVK